MAVGSNPFVPIMSAAERAGVNVQQIRRWAEVEGIEIQRRGGIELVSMERVLALAASAQRVGRNASRDGLRARLRDAAAQRGNGYLPRPGGAR